MKNRELIYNKIDELMNLTIDCDFIEEDYVNLLELVKERIYHKKSVSYEKQIKKLIKKIKELDASINFVPVKLVKISGIKVIEDSILENWRNKKFAQNKLFKKLLANEEINLLYNKLLDIYSDYNEGFPKEFIDKWNTYNNDGLFLCCFNLENDIPENEFVCNYEEMIDLNGE